MWVYAPAMARSFGSLLKAHIDYIGISQREFAKRIGAKQPTVNAIINGTRTPPLDEIDSWADQLGLKGVEREDFLETACLEHCPEPIRQAYAKLKAQVVRMEQRMNKLEEQR